MDAIVQLIRNALCCVKDLNLLPTSPLHDPSVTAQYYVFPSPLNKTTPLEIMICVTQFYAFVTVSKSGLYLILSSLGKHYRINRLIDLRTKACEKKKAVTIADRLINESLIKEGELSIRNLFIGANVLPIGIAFLWLTANSLHITETDWIGGIWGLIHALTVMEICLLPLLYYMLTDTFSHLAKSRQIMEFVAKYKKEDAKTRSLLLPTDDDNKTRDASQSVSLSTFEMVTDWKPFFEEGFGMFGDKHSSNPPKETKDLEEEVLKVEKLLEQYGSNSDGEEEKKTKERSADDRNEKEEKIRIELLQQTTTRLENKAHTSKMEGYREFLYFLFNFIAFYGYMLGVLVFYFDKEDDQSSYVRSLKLGYNNADADWHGNFAGDLMWTIEPIVTLASPMFFTYMKSYPSPSAKKEKKD